jgi:hypothetical protein
MDGIVLNQIAVTPDHEGMPVPLAAKTMFTYAEPRQIHNGQVLINVTVGRDTVRGWAPIADTEPVGIRATVEQLTLRLRQHEGKTFPDADFRACLADCGTTMDSWPAQDQELMAGQRASLVGRLRLLMLPLAGEVIAAVGSGDLTGAGSYPVLLKGLPPGLWKDVLPAGPGHLMAAVTEWAAGQPGPQEVDTDDLNTEFSIALDGLAVFGQDAPGAFRGVSVDYRTLPTEFKDGAYTWPPRSADDVAWSEANGDIKLNQRPRTMAVRPQDATVRSALSREALDAGDLPVVRTYRLPAGLDALYLTPDAPERGDIRQGGLGDCFFLALLSTVARHDPGQIVRMIGADMADDSSKLTVQFWRRIEYADGSAIACPQRIKLTPLLAVVTAVPATAQPVAGSGPPAPPASPDPGSVYGARLRVAPGPVSWALREPPQAARPDPQPSEGEDATAAGPYIQQEIVTATALWAPLMEKAFAVFAACFGLSDRDTVTDDPPPTSPDYEAIGSGIETTHPLFRVIYGARLADSEGISLSDAAVTIWASRPPSADTDLEDRTVQITQETDEDEVAQLEETASVQVAGPGITQHTADPVTPPLPVPPRVNPGRRLVQTLCQLQAQTAGQRGTLVLCVVCALRTRLARRLVQLLPKLAAPSAGELPTRVSGLTQAALNSPQRPIVLDGAWRQAAGELFDALAPEAADPGRPQARLAARICQLLLTMMNGYQERRYVLSSHDYGLLEAALVFDGESPAAPDQVTDAHLNGLNMDRSTVVICNPHHGDSPGFPAAAPSPDSGTFTMTVRDFLAIFTNLELATVRPAGAATST